MADRKEVSSAKSRTTWTQSPLLPFATLMNIEPVEFGDGTAKVRVVVEQRHLRTLGIAHGGVTSTLLDMALGILSGEPPDVLNHNIETVPRLYKEARPGADFQNSLNLLQHFKQRHPSIPTKSGIMVGLGEIDAEILQVMHDLRSHGVTMLTIGQYLQPTGGHMLVHRYVHPDMFEMYEKEAYKMGFLHAASGPLVRSSYHADQQAHAAGAF